MRRLEGDTQLSASRRAQVPRRPSTRDRADSAACSMQGGPSIATMAALVQFEADMDRVLSDIRGEPAPEGPPARDGRASMAQLVAAIMEDDEPTPPPTREAQAEPDAALVVHATVSDRGTTLASTTPSAPRFRRIAAPKSQHRRVCVAPDELVRLASGLSLRVAMPVPRHVPAMQTLVPAPLGHQKVSTAVPKGRLASSKQTHDLERKCNAETKKLKKYDPEQAASSRVRLLSHRWADTRYRAGRFCLWLLTRDNGMDYEFGGAQGTGILTHSECAEAVRLLDKATCAAASYPENHRLELASPPFWALALALQVCRQREGLVIETDEQKYRFSFQGMVDTYQRMQQLSVGQRIPEPFYDFAAEMRRPELDRTAGVLKYVGKHSLGSSGKVWKKKIDCLHAMLKLADEDGLSHAVREMRGPIQEFYDEPPTRSRKAREAAKSGWGKKKKRL